MPVNPSPHVKANDEDFKDFISRKQLAKHMGTTLQTLRNMESEGTLPSAYYLTSSSATRQGFYFKISELNMNIVNHQAEKAVTKALNLLASHGYTITPPQQGG